MEKNSVKILILVLILVAIGVHLYFSPVQVKLGGADEFMPTSDKIASDVSTLQTEELQTKGTYIHIPEKKYIDGSTVVVNEMLFPDGKRGYQIVTTTYETVVTATSTYKIEHIDSVGYGASAKEFTYKK